MDAYNPAGWAAVFAAIAGASAGLTGLLFVALSINLSRVLKQPGWIGRAVEVLYPTDGIFALQFPGQGPNGPFTCTLTSVDVPSGTTLAPHQPNDWTMTVT